MPPREKLNREGETPVGWSAESLELPLPAGLFHGLISACIQECLEGLSEFGADHLDAEHNVKSLVALNARPAASNSRSQAAPPMIAYGSSCPAKCSRNLAIPTCRCHFGRTWGRACQCPCRDVLIGCVAYCEAIVYRYS